MKTELQLSNKNSDIKFNYKPGELQDTILCVCLSVFVVVYSWM